MLQESAMVPMNSLSFRSSSNNAGKLSGSPHSMGSSPPRLLFPQVHHLQELQYL